jgi:hypothetical protein
LLDRLVASLGVCLILSTALPHVSIAQGSQGGSREQESAPESGRIYWYDDYDREGLVSAGWLNGPKALQGYQVGYGLRVNSDEMPGRAVAWFSQMRGGKQEVDTLRAELGMWPINWTWGGVGPLLGLGVEYRSETPHQGFGGFLSAGVDVAVFTPRHWQLTMSWQHAFAISSDSRNILSLAIAYAHPSLTIGPVHD